MTILTFSEDRISQDNFIFKIVLLDRLDCTFFVYVFYDNITIKLRNQVILNALKFRLSTLESVS